MEQDILTSILEQLKFLTHEISDVKMNQSTLTKNQNELAENQKVLSNRVLKVETKMDHGISKIQDLLLESQKGLIAHVNELEPKVEENQSLKGRVMTLERVTDAHSTDIDELKKRIG